MIQLEKEKEVTRTSCITKLSNNQTFYTRNIQPPT